MVTQKETFSAHAVTVASKEVVLFRVEEFNSLLDKLYSRTEAWERVRRNAHQRFAFIDSVISPHELFRLFIPREDPVMSRVMVDNTL